jgi:hypothetical protein
LRPRQITINNLQRSQKKWSEQFNAVVKPEHVICDGCKAEKRRSFYCANLCKIRKCCIVEKYDSCIECGNFTCSDGEKCVR